MYVNYTDIGHHEKRAELWAWAPGLPNLWRASTIYKCFGPKEDSMTGPAHYNCLGRPYESQASVPASWYEAQGYAQGRVSYADKRISLSMSSYDRRRFDYVVKLLCRAWPGFAIYRNGAEIFASDESENLVEAA